MKTRHLGGEFFVLVGYWWVSLVGNYGYLSKASSSLVYVRSCFGCRANWGVNYINIEWEIVYA